LKINKTQIDRRRSVFAEFEKENGNGVGLGLSANSEWPVTPIRSNSTTSQSLFRSVVNPATFGPPMGMTPSPASSSELSPVGQKMMMGVRQQRMKARKADREKKHRRGGFVGNRL
jgi:hypothetical protein